MLVRGSDCLWTVCGRGPRSGSEFVVWVEVIYLQTALHPFPYLRNCITDPVSIDLTVD
ncbi:hypothetical protein J6590_105391 [Homalodisca vitripennis]|nr:hypothetical protein J6590_005482 [Homalodisca vitripennis]KAG8323875.1 hypothetical protein J6590_105391 [Homalodisca vitripennis]